MLSVECRGAFVALDGVFLGCGEVVRVCVGRAPEDDLGGGCGYFGSAGCD